MEVLINSLAEFLQGMEPGVISDNTQSLSPETILAAIVENSNSSVDVIQDFDWWIALDYDFQNFQNTSLLDNEVIGTFLSRTIPFRSSGDDLLVQMIVHL